MQRLDGIEPLLLVGIEERPDLVVQLFHDCIGLFVGLLMDGIELRLHRFDLGLHLRLLRIGQRERVGKHRGKVRRPVMESGRRWIVAWLCAGESPARHDGRRAEDDEFVCFHFVCLLLQQQPLFGVGDTCAGRRLQLVFQFY
jgi:hypothetical protein